MQSSNTPHQKDFVKLMKNHPKIKNLAPQKVVVIRKNFEKIQKEGSQQIWLKEICRSFVDKASPQLLQMITEMMNRQFLIYLKNQNSDSKQRLRKLKKQFDDQKKRIQKFGQLPLSKSFNVISQTKLKKREK